MDTLTGDEAPHQPIARSPEVSRWLYDNTPIPETKRFWEMDRREAHYVGRQYAHQEHDWWGMSADQTETISPSIMVPRGFEQPALNVSVRNKRPTSPYHLVRAVVDRFTGLLFSEGRKPEVVVENDADTQEMLRAAMHQCRFWPMMREARTIGGATGTVCVTVHLREGKYAMEVHNGKFLTVLWKDRRTHTPRGILKQYRFEVERPGRDPDSGDVVNRKVTYLVRRIITEDEDIVFKPVEIEDGRVPQMEVADHVPHNLGFFPGVWIQNLPVLEDDDGDPDCEGAYQTQDTIDRLLSQANKGTLLNMDPTVVMKVDPKVVALGGGQIRKGSDNTLNVGNEGDAHYLEINGTGITVAMELVERLKQNFLDMVACVIVDPTVISGAAQSAKAIEYLYSPMLEKADILRSQYGDLGIIPLCEIMIKLASWANDQRVETEAGPARLAIDLPKKVTRFEPSFDAHAGARPVTHAVPHRLGPGGHIKLVWGPYFSPTEQDKQLAVNTLVAAKEAGLIDDETAVHAAAQLFKVKEPGQMFKKIKAAQEDEADRAQATLNAGVLPPGADPNDPNAPPHGEPKPGKPGKPGDADKPPQFPPPPGAIGAKPQKTPPAGGGGKP